MQQAGLNSPSDKLESEEIPLPEQWTDSWAGSLEKVQIMRQRAESGVHIHHPHDCKQIVVKDRLPLGLVLALMLNKKKSKRAD
jgi:hypothetical protein